MRSLPITVAVLLLAGATLAASAAKAYESDTYENRLAQVKDALPALDRHVNGLLRDVIKAWHGPRDDMKFAAAVYWKLGGLYWVGHVERWAMSSPEIERYPQSRYRNIYAGIVPWATRVTAVVGVGATIKVDGIMIGTDKLGHFFSQGMTYYKEKQAGWSDERVYRRGATMERWFYGQFTTGIYANADLVANYEGERFYRSLFESGIVANKPPIIAWHGDTPVLNRPFTFADHINAYWDEALNPSWMIPSLESRLRPRIKALCAGYRARPSRYTVQDDAALWARYQKIGLKDMRENQFRRVCRKGGDDSQQRPAGPAD